MSYPCSIADAKAAIASVEESHASTIADMHSSPILRGKSAPGGELVPKRTKVKVRTSSLTRKYAASNG